MKTNEINRYPDKDLEKFRELIEEKIAKAQHDLELIRSAYMNDGNNGTDDTSPTFKAFEEGSETCLLYTSPSPRDLSTSRMPSSA